MHPDDDKFFGCDSVGAGYLGRHIRFLYVPAVRDATDDDKDGKGSALGELLDLTIKKALAEKAEFKDLPGRIKDLYAEAIGGENTPELDDLREGLSRTLNALARGEFMSNRIDQL